MVFAPEIIHFIWLGSHIPTKYLNSIATLNNRLRVKKSKIKIYLWCDKKINIYATSGKLDLPITFAQVEIKTIMDDLLPNMQLDPAFSAGVKSMLRFLRFNYITQLESIGASNFATVSDIYRLSILWEFGGLYCDTDTEFGEIAITSSEELYFGIKANFYLNDKTTIDTWLENGGISITGNNDIIVTHAKCKFIMRVLDETLDYLNTMQKASLYKYSFLNHIKGAYLSGLDFDSDVVDSKPLGVRNSIDILSIFYDLEIMHAQGKYSINITPFDAKRCIKQTVFLPSHYNRTKISISCGVALFLSCLRKEVMAELYVIDTTQKEILVEKFKYIFTQYSIKHSGSKVFGIPIIPRSDMTWVNKPKKGVRPRSYTI